MIGHTLGHYRILEKIGSGGMGEVYRARDERLERDVAIKVLPAGTITDQASRTRFHKEALALARLNHPNIGVVYDFDRQDETDFLAMEYIGGTTLASQLTSGALPEKEAVKLGQQVAAALEEAHERGVIHRDLKPGNILVTPKRQAKVLDFGLARLLKNEGDVAATETSTDTEAGAGTLLYMAPEQLRGEAADARTDIHALGTVLYEMVTGQRAFKETLAPRLIDAILNRAPVPPRALNTSVSQELEQIILKCLDKDPERRYQSAREVRVDLERQPTPGPTSFPQRDKIRTRRWQLGVGAILALALAVGGYAVYHRHTQQSGQATLEATALVVLPFQVLAGGEDVNFLGVGVADALITRLANVREIRVRPTSAVLGYESRTADVQEIGRALKASNVLSGTIQKAGERFRVRVQLVRVADGAPIWGEEYDLARADLFSLQDGIAERVTAALRVRVTAEEQARLRRRYTENTLAHEAYLKGRAHLARYTKESTLAAVVDFEDALRLDQSYAPAHAGLAMASAQMRIRFSPQTELQSWTDRAEREAGLALKLEPQLAEAHEALAAVYRSVEFDWDRTIEESGRALELNPNLDMPHYYRAAAFYHLGLMDLVKPEVEAALAANPSNLLEAARLRGATALFSGQFQEAVTELEEADRLSASPVSGGYLAQAHYYLGEQSRGEKMLAALRGSAQAERRAQAALASFLAERGEKAKAEDLARAASAEGYMDHHVAYSLGVAHTQLGRREEALRWLRRAAETGFPCHPWFTVDPLLQPLRNDAEFRRLLEELRAREEIARRRYGGGAPGH
jgi:TolB-like protein/predicted Ser/Thr protein kinase